VSISAKSTPILSKLFDLYVPSVLPYLRRNLQEPLPTVNNGLVEGKNNLISDLSYYHLYSLFVRMVRSIFLLFLVSTFVP
jgi:hypothetical protein